MKLPGMVHARNVRPPFAGATLQRIDESSVADIPGFIRVVSRGNYVAVICEREEQAINAARQLKAEWKKPATAPFPASDELFNYMRRATPTSTGEPQIQGDPDAAFAGARESSRPSTRFLSRVTPPLVRRTHWPILPTDR